MITICCAMICDFRWIIWFSAAVASFSFLALTAARNLTHWAALLSLITLICAFAEVIFALCMARFAFFASAFIFAHSSFIVLFIPMIVAQFELQTDCSFLSLLNRPDNLPLKLPISALVGASSFFSELIMDESMLAPLFLLH